MNPVLIVGGSARAAAQSVRRAGGVPITIDAFADRDLDSLAGVSVRVAQYPDELVQVAQRFPPSDWLYTGALENHPAIIADISTRHHLLGTPAENLASVRDPRRLFDQLRAQQIAFPNTVWTANERSALQPHHSTTWLRKARRSGGGQQIHWCHSPASGTSGTASTHANANANASAGGDTDTPADDDAASSYYWQEYLPGESYGAVFLAAGGQADLWGITAQLVGRNWPHDSPPATNPATNLAMNLATNPATAAELLTRANFDYAGSIGPLSFSAELETEIQRIGKTIARLGNLSGIFGVDLLIPSSSLATPQPTTTAQIFVLEVNPRWTASVEILERATGQNAFQLHQAACTQGQLLPPRARAAASLHGKLVVYAEKQLEVSSALSDRWLDRAQGQTWPTLADIPRAGEMIPAGAPICTLFASALTPANVATQLQTARAELRRG